MITDEEKKEGIWEFQGKKFKRCPQCDKAILAEWKSHGCGWGKTATEESAISDENVDMSATSLVTECLKEAKDIAENLFKQDGFSDTNWVIQIADMIRRTKLVYKFPKK